MRRRWPRRAAAAIRRRAGGDDGMGLVELMAAMVVLSVGMFGVASSLVFTSQAVSLNRMRQTAAEIAQARIEHLQNIPFTDLGTYQMTSGTAVSFVPTQSIDPTSPDYLVSGTQYNVTGQSGGTLEDLIGSSRGVEHLQNPVVIGTTQVQIFQYVTWGDTATFGFHKVKRFTVVVRYTQSPVAGVSQTLRTSSIVAPDNLTIGGATTTVATTVAPTTTTTVAPTTTTVATTSTTAAGPTTTASGTTTTTAATTTTTSAICPGDTSGPTGSFTLPTLNGTTAVTNNATITIGFSYTDSCGPVMVSFSSDGVTYGTELNQSLVSTASFTLPAGDGTRTVYAKARDKASNVTVQSKPILLDTVAPTIPASSGPGAVNIWRTGLNCDTAQYRVVTVNWGASTDTNLSGYRLYRSVNNGAFSVLTTTSTATRNYQDTTGSRDDSVRYKVTAYDLAGNESASTTTLSLPKC